MKILVIIATILFSASSYACKLTPIGYAKIATSAALDAVNSINSDLNVKSISLGENHYVEVRSEANGVEYRNLFIVSIDPDCFVSVVHVKLEN